MPPDTQAPPLAPVVTKEAIKPGMFNGMLRQWQYGAYASLIHAGVANTVAHKVALDYASDIGRAMSKDGKFRSKIGKLTDDGERTIALAGKSYIKASDSMSIVYVCQTLDTLFQEELLGSRKLPKLSDGLQDYIESCEKWATEQKWAMPKKDE